MVATIDLSTQAIPLSCTTPIIANQAITAAKMSPTDLFTLNQLTLSSFVLTSQPHTWLNPNTFQLPTNVIRPSYISTNAADDFQFPNNVTAAQLTIQAITNVDPITGNPVLTPAGDCSITGASLSILFASGNGGNLTVQRNIAAQTLALSENLTVGNTATIMSLDVNGVATLTQLAVPAPVDSVVQNIQFNGNLVQDMRIENVFVNPPTGHPGRLIWRADIGQMLVDTGVAWEGVGQSGGGTIIASLIQGPIGQQLSLESDSDLVYVINTNNTHPTSEHIWETGNATFAQSTIQGVNYTAVHPGDSGDAISIQYIVDTTPGNESVFVTVPAILVHISPTTQASTVQFLVSSNALASTLVNTVLVGSPTLIQVAQPQTYLVGGDSTIMTLDTSGNLSVVGTTTVTGATSLLSTLDVTGATHLHNLLDVIGASTLHSTLDVTSAANMHSTLDATGATTLHNTLDVTLATHLHNTLDVTGATIVHNTLESTGAATMDTTLDVLGVLTAHNNLHVQGTGQFDTTLDITGVVTAHNNLHVIGTSTLDGAVTDNSTLDVIDATNLHDTLDVTNATTLHNTLDVTNAATLHNTLDVTLATTLHNSLDVTLAATMHDTLDVTAAATMHDTLDVTAATNLHSTLGVTGVATFATQVGIGTLTPAASALVDMTSTTQGLLIPRMTTAQRNAISSPAIGLTIYNLDSNLFNFWTGIAWLPVGSPVGAVGDVQFNAGGGLFGANPNFYWDIANARLGIGNAAPAYGLDVTGEMRATVAVHTPLVTGTSPLALRPGAGSDGPNAVTIQNAAGAINVLSVNTFAGQMTLNDGGNGNAVEFVMNTDNGSYIVFQNAAQTLNSQILSVDGTQLLLRTNNNANTWTFNPSGNLVTPGDVDVAGHNLQHVSTIYDPAGTRAIWLNGQRAGFDLSNVSALDWNARQCIANDGATPNIDWHIPNSVTVASYPSVGSLFVRQTHTGYLFDQSNNEIMNVNNNELYDTSLTIAMSFGTAARKLYDFAGTSAVDFGTPGKVSLVNGLAYFGAPTHEGGLGLHIDANPGGGNSTTIELMGASSNNNFSAIGFITGDNSTQIALIYANNTGGVEHLYLQAAGESQPGDVTIQNGAGQQWLFDQNGVLTTPGNVIIPHADLIIKCAPSSANSLTFWGEQNEDENGQIDFYTHDGSQFLGEISGWLHANSPFNGNPFNLIQLNTNDSFKGGVSAIQSRIEFLTRDAAGTTYTWGPNEVGTFSNLPDFTATQLSAVLQIDSTTRGFLPPRMTSTQKNAIASPATGLVVYDATENEINFYNGTAWVSVNDSTDYIVRETPTGTVNGVNVTFTLAFTPIAGKESVYLNGVLQDPPSDYTISGATITFTTAPITNSKVRVSYIK